MVSEKMDSFPFFLLRFSRADDSTYNSDFHSKEHLQFTNKTLSNLILFTRFVMFATAWNYFIRSSIESKGWNSVRNLQYGPQTRLVRSIYDLVTGEKQPWSLILLGFFFLVLTFHCTRLSFNSSSDTIDSSSIIFGCWQVEVVIYSK